MLIILNSYWYI